jgi:two-component system alkaline phosphatase synthesis response regulator PhoP
MRGQGKKKPGKKTPTILVVDDEAGVRVSMRLLFQNQGINIIEANSAKSAWDILKKNKPNLILLDILMPGEDGLKFLGELRKKDLSTPVVMLTALNTARCAITAMSLGADDYITKPFDVDDLRAKVGNLLSKKPDELEPHRFKKLARVFAEENERLWGTVAELHEKLRTGTVIEDKDKYRAILSAVAHSLRAEFMHIGSSLKALREMVGEARGVQDECETIERSIEYVQLHLRRVLNYLDIGKPKVEPMTVLELLRRTEKLARPRLPANIQLEITVDEGLKERTVSGNIEQFMAILLELVHNAVTASREEGGSIEQDYML